MFLLYAKNVVVLVIAILLFSTPAIAAVPTSTNGLMTDTKGSFPVSCERDNPHFALRNCDRRYSNDGSEFIGSVIDTLERPIIKQGVKYIKEYKGKPSIVYSAEYAIPSGKRVRSYLAQQVVTLTCIKKNGIPRDCCSGEFPSAFGIDKNGVERTIYQNTGIQCDQGETLRVEWFTNSDENEKALDSLEKMGRFVKGNVIVRQAKLNK